MSLLLLGLSWVVGNAEELPFDDDKFDVYTIAFGIRNVTHIDQVIKSSMTWGEKNFKVLLSFLGSRKNISCDQLKSLNL